MFSDSLRTWAEVDLDAVLHNFLAARNRLPEHMKLLVTVKANGYGHGAIPIAKLLEDKADYFALATMDEAVQLRQAGIRTPLLILGPVLPADYKRAAQHDVALTVSSLEEAKAISDCAALRGKRITVHFALDTGMSRIGFPCTEEAALELREAAQLPGIIPEGVFSHFAMSDSKDKSYVNLQTGNFRRMLGMAGVDFPIRHLYNSAAIADLEPEFDMAREGIVLYGLQPSNEVDGSSLGVKPVMALRSHVSFVKHLPAGTPISYGCTYVTRKDSVIATVMAGYADGIPRLLSNRGEVIIRGVKAPIVGRVCMDQFMVDVTHIPGVCAGDTVTVFGTDGSETITADQVAEKAKTIGYELVCGIAPRVPRVYLRSNQVDSISRSLPENETYHPGE